MPRGAPGRARNRIPEEIKRTIIDNIINKGMSLRESGEAVTPQLSTGTVGAILRTYQKEHRTRPLQYGRGRKRLMTDEQEYEVIEMVQRNMTIDEMKNHIKNDNDIFANIGSISTTTISRILKRHGVTTDTFHKVPFARNSQSTKNLRAEYVTTILRFDNDIQQVKYIFLDVAGFNLNKRRRRGRNIIGERATVQDPQQRGGNITMCAALSNDGLVHYNMVLGPYDTQDFLEFIYRMTENLIAAEGNATRCVVIVDDVPFYRTLEVKARFANHGMDVVYLPPYSPFLNPAEEFFSAWRWRVYSHEINARNTLLRALQDFCSVATRENCAGWFRDAQEYFPCCLASEDIYCDVDKNLWPNPNERMDIVRNENANN